jgi:hypothetical protein
MGGGNVVFSGQIDQIFQSGGISDEIHKALFDPG